MVVEVRMIANGLQVGQKEVKMQLLHDVAAWVK